jgi:phosphoadenosine phosphosulfate reductase
VKPLKGALAGKAAWITGLKRVDAATRAAIPVVGFDDAFGLVKINPLATWSDEDIASYEADHDLPVHPLMTKGYRSIGCAPTTRPVADGEDPRAGRWADSDKTECGLHA